MSKQRELTHQERTFLAALKGIDLNKDSSSNREFDPDEMNLEPGNVVMTDMFGYQEES